MLGGQLTKLAMEQDQKIVFTSHILSKDPRWFSCPLNELARQERAGLKALKVNNLTPLLPLISREVPSYLRLQQAPHYTVRKHFLLFQAASYWWSPQVGGTNQEAGHEAQHSDRNLAKQGTSQEREIVAF